MELFYKVDNYKQKTLSEGEPSSSTGETCWWYSLWRLHHAATLCILFALLRHLHKL